MSEIRLEKTRDLYDEYTNSLKEFHRKFDHYVGDSPGFPPQEVIDLRLKLIMEEATELVTACHLGNLELVADAVADLLYVTFGTAVSFGLPIRRVFAEVHRSNMTKSMEKDEKSIKGKTLKGDNYVPPNIKATLWGS